MLSLIKRLKEKTNKKDVKKALIHGIKKDSTFKVKYVPKINTINFITKSNNSGEDWEKNSMHFFDAICNYLTTDIDMIGGNYKKSWIVDDKCFLYSIKFNNSYTYMEHKIKLKQYLKTLK